jgi:hypothetical protein
MIKSWEAVAKHRIKQAKKGNYDHKALSYFMPEREPDSTYRLAYTTLKDMGGEIADKQNEGEFTIIADLKKKGQIVIFKATEGKGGTDFTLTVHPRTYILMHYWNREDTRKEILQRMKVIA